MCVLLENSQLEAVNLNESNLCEQLKVQYTLYLQWKVPYVFIERYFFSSRVSFGGRQGSFSWPVVLCGKFSYIFFFICFLLHTVSREQIFPQTGFIVKPSLTATSLERPLFFAESPYIDSCLKELCYETQTN